MKPKHSQQQRNNSSTARKNAVASALPISTLANKTQFQHSMVFAVVAYLGIAQTAEIVTHQNNSNAQFSPLQAAYELNFQNTHGLLEQTADISTNLLSEMPPLTVRLQSPVSAPHPLYIKLQPEFALKTSMADTLADSAKDSTANTFTVAAPIIPEIAATPESAQETLPQAKLESVSLSERPAILHVGSPAQYTTPDHFYEADQRPGNGQLAQGQEQPPHSTPEEFMIITTAAVEAVDNSRLESVEGPVSTNLIDSKSFVSTLPESEIPDYELDYYKIALDESLLVVENYQENSELHPAPPLVFHSSETSRATTPDSATSVDSTQSPDSINVYTESLPGLLAYDVIHPVVIVVDPGHGGVDPGTIGKFGMQEQELTLDMAKRLQTLATLHKDIEVVLTREDDDGLSRLERIGKVASAKADLLISLHFNHLPEGDITLVETYYTDTTDDLQASAVRHQAGADLRTLPARNLPQQARNPAANAAVSRSFARHLQAGVFGAVQNRNPLAIDAGVKRQSLYLLAQSGLPGALVEITCLSNPQEENRLRTEQYRNELANSLMQSLRKFVNSENLAKSI